MNHRKGCDIFAGNWDLSEILQWDDPQASDWQSCLINMPGKCNVIKNLSQWLPNINICCFYAWQRPTILTNYHSVPNPHKWTLSMMFISINLFQKLLTIMHKQSIFLSVWYIQYSFSISNFSLFNVLLQEQLTTKYEREREREQQYNIYFRAKFHSNELMEVTVTSFSKDFGKPIFSYNHIISCKNCYYWFMKIILL